MTPEFGELCNLLHNKWPKGGAFAAKVKIFGVCASSSHFLIGKLVNDAYIAYRVYQGPYLINFGG